MSSYDTYKLASPAEDEADIIASSPHFETLRDEAFADLLGKLKQAVDGRICVEDIEPVAEKWAVEIAARETKERIDRESEGDGPDDEA